MSPGVSRRMVMDMKSVSNKSRKPLRIPLPGGKALFLGPGKTGQIADRAADLPAVKRLLDAGEIEIHGEGTGPAGGGPQSGSSAHAATHGHVPNTMMRPKGDR